MRRAGFFILKSGRQPVASGRTKGSGKIGYGGTLSRLLGKKEGTPVSAYSFSVQPGFRDDDRGVWVSHPEPETVYISEGQFHYSMVSPDGAVRKEITVKAGDLLYVAPGTYHRGHGVGNQAYRGIVFCPKPLSGEIKSIFTEDSKMPGAGDRYSERANKRAAPRTQHSRN